MKRKKVTLLVIGLSTSIICFGKGESDNWGSHSSGSSYDSSSATAQSDSASKEFYKVDDTSIQDFFKQVDSMMEQPNEDIATTTLPSYD